MTWNYQEREERGYILYACILKYRSVQVIIESTASKLKQKFHWFRKELLCIQSPLALSFFVSRDEQLPVTGFCNRK